MLRVVAGVLLLSCTHNHGGWGPVAVGGARRVKQKVDNSDEKIEEALQLIHIVQPDGGAQLLSAWAPSLGLASYASMLFIVAAASALGSRAGRLVVAAAVVLAVSGPLVAAAVLLAAQVTNCRRVCVRGHFRQPSVT